MSLKKRDAVPEKNNNTAMTACMVVTVLVILLYQVPWGRYILYPMTLLSTFVHEFGHGIGALLAGGFFDYFEMWSNASGLAHCAVPGSDLGEAFCVFSGLAAPSIVSAVCFVIGRSAKASRIGFYVFSVLMVLADIIYVRTLFGIIFVALAAAAAFITAHFPKSDEVPRYAMLFCAITLGVTVFTRADYLFTDTAHTTAGVFTSDVGLIAKYLFPPYWFWGALIGIFSVLVLFVGLKVFFYTKKDKKALPKE